MPTPNTTASIGDINLISLLQESGLTAQQIADTLLLTSKGPINVKTLGVKGDGVTDDTIAIRNALNLIIAGGTLIFPIGKYLISSNILISGKWLNSGNINIIGEASSSVVDVRTGDFLYGTVFVYTSPTGDCLTVDGVLGLPDDYTNAIDHITIKNISIVGSTSGTLLSLKRTPAGNFKNITIRNNGTGKGLYLYDVYESNFKRVFISSSTKVVGSIGLHYDTYNGGGGMASFDNCLVSYQDTGVLLGSTVTGAANGYRGLEATMFKSCEINNCNTNLVIKSPVSTLTPNNQYNGTNTIVFQSCYFELAAVTNFVIGGGKNVIFRESTINHGVLTGPGCVLGGDLNQSRGLNVTFDHCDIFSPIVTHIFKFTVGCYGKLVLTNNIIKNNGNLSFTYDDILTTGMSFILGNNSFRNWSEGLFLDNASRRFVTSEGNKSSVFTLTNTNLDCSTWVAPPAFIKSETYTAGSIIYLPNNTDIVEGCEITVRRTSSSNTFTFDAGTGNTIYVGGTGAQTYAGLAYPNKITLKCSVTSGVITWYDI